MASAKLSFLALFIILGSALIPETVLGRAVRNSDTIKDTSVLILGGGVSRIIAARTLHKRGHNNFIVVEARSKLGGRLQTHIIGREGNIFTVKQGANWVQGTQTGSGFKYPILTLVEKHGVKTQLNDWSNSGLSFFDFNGPAGPEFKEAFQKASDGFDALTIGAGKRIQSGLLDLNARSGYSLSGSKPSTPALMASEYYLFDWEYAQTPKQTSWLGSSLANNFTYDADMGGFSEDNLMSIDQRSFKTFIQAEASEFLNPLQLKLNSTVKSISHSTNGVSVTLTNGKELTADYALVTFSVGVLQHDDVVFDPALPDWKQEAIQKVTMATYTKVFLQFLEVFWFNTEMAIYADQEHGKYPVWQSLDHESFFFQGLE